MFQHVLVPLDGSRTSTRAMAYAVDIAKRFGARITFLQVVTPITPVYPVEASGMSDPSGNKLVLEETRRQEAMDVAQAKRYLAAKVRTTVKQGLQAESRVIMGKPAESIMEVSHRGKADLIVMTTHGKSGLKRAIMGSVADKVIRESGVPVLVIRSKKGARK